MKNKTFLFIFYFYFYIIGYSSDIHNLYSILLKPRKYVKPFVLVVKMIS